MPSGITIDAQGNVWFTEQADDSVWKITQGGVPSRIWREAGSRPFEIIPGPDGNLWFTEGETDQPSRNAVGRLTPDGTWLGETSLPLPASGACNPSAAVGSNPVGLAAGTDSVWVTGYNACLVYVLSREGRLVGSYPVPNNPNRITVGPDGNLWITETLANRLAVLAPGAPFGIKPPEYPVSGPPTAIVSGPPSSPNTLWFTSYGTNKIQGITTGGNTTAPLPAGTGPGGLVVGPDGNLWFTELGGKRIGVMTTNGDVRWIALTGGTPFGITKEPGGRIWFTVQGDSASNPDAIGVVG